LSTETKAGFKTTEFVAFLAVVVGILVAAAVTKATFGHHDHFTAAQAWLFVAIVTAGYMISRGLAKSGSKQYYDERQQRSLVRVSGIRAACSRARRAGRR
jgi:hypothetical protein